MSKPLNVQVGDRFGRWVVLARVASGQGGRRYECLCDPEVGGCGNRGEIAARILVYGESRSCGCLKRELAREAATTHGLVGHELFDVYRGMLERCSNSNNSSWPRYGGRGITVCERWRGPNGVTAFVEDMAPRPEGTQLHRIDNDRGYSRENCEWVSRGEHGQKHAAIHRRTELRIQELETELRRLRPLAAGGLVPPKVHEDERGVIRDVTTEHWDAATRIFTRAGAIRGNHYHKATWQMTLLLSGCLRVVTETDEARREFFLRSEEWLLLTPPNERHAWQAVEDTTVIVLTRGPRSGENYESDTFRLEEPLIA